MSANPKAAARARVTFLGHSTVAIEAAGTRLLTDPLLRPSLLGFLRRRHPLAGLGAAESPDAVLLSHLHHDHLDLRSLGALPAGTPIVAPRRSAPFLARHGFDTVTELDEGESVEIGSAQVTAVHAEHRSGGRPRAPHVAPLGYVIDAGTRIYFAGDTELFDGMREIRPGLDLALLPVWGWGPRLGSGHLNPETAARALTLLEPRIAIPIHWGTYTPIGSSRLWPWLATDPGHRFAERAAKLAPEVEVRVLAPGEALDIAPDAGKASI